MTSNFFLISFTNNHDILDNEFKTMIDRMLDGYDKTDDYELRKMIKHILAKDYYKKAVAWFNKFKDADWYRDDLT